MSSRRWRRRRREGHPEEPRAAPEETRPCSALRVLRGMFAIFLNVRPSSLASRSGPGGGGPNGHLNPAIESDTARIVTGFGNANWIQAC